MIYPLVFCCHFQLLRLAHACPQNIVLRTIRWYYPYACSFHSIYHRVVNVRRVMDLKTHCHVFVYHSKLVYFLYLLSGPFLLNNACIIYYSQETFLSFNLEAVLRVRKEYPHMFLNHFNSIRLNQSNIRIMRFQD